MPPPAPLDVLSLMVQFFRLIVKVARSAPPPLLIPPPLVGLAVPVKWLPEIVLSAMVVKQGPMHQMPPPPASVEEFPLMMQLPGIADNHIS